ncbi:MAG: ABC transporter ATP-binding protein [Spirochaetaceae bacterium]|nr:ABC transporter ATP-binding protein [Spirochaetaceae bacterium]
MEGTGAVGLEGVGKEYGNGPGAFSALRAIDLDVRQGEYLGITGKSGSGKTTLLNLITGIDRPTRGTVRLGGRLVNGLSENAMAVLRGRGIGIVFQFYQLLPTLNIEENVMLPMDFAGGARADGGRAKRERARALLARMGILDQAGKLPGSLSGGQQQRAAIARALANDPELLVADEPTGNLDSANAEGIYELFDGLVSEGKTVILVSHDPGIESRVRRVVRLRDGVVASDGRIEHA